MTKRIDKQKIEKLKKTINYYGYLYHVLDKQEISDAAFDKLKHQLYKLEKKYPDFITHDSPTQRVGGRPLKKFEKVEHKTPMLSIEDVFLEKELKEWKNRISRKMQDIGLLAKHKTKTFNYFAERKIDGFAISLVYKKGVFSQGSTRGNGKVGEDVTQNLKTIKSIPLKLKIFEKMPNKKIKENTEKLIKNKTIEIRGEVFMDKKTFKEINKQREKQKESTYANPRNIAAGSIRQLDPKLAASRNLKFLAYDIVTDLGQTTHQQEHQIAKALGFKTDEGRLCKNLDKAIRFWKEIESKREKLPYQIDGVVVNTNNNEIFKKLGIAGKAPRGRIALKFPGKQATTKVKDIKIQIGRTGVLTPVAYLEPIKLGGTTITRATLHNQDEIDRLDVKIGDTIIVQRAGDVIPNVVKALPRMRTGNEKKFHIPEKCPICGSRVIRLKGEVCYRCSNKHCGAVQKQKIYYFVSKKAFDINGFGPKIVDKLMDENLISDIGDIFELEQGDLIPLERFAEKSAINLIQAIKNSKKVLFHRFIYALGIRHIGEETAIDLANHFKNLKELGNINKEELEKIENIGEVVTKSIYNWFQNKKNLKLLDKLKRAGVKIQYPNKVQANKLQNKTFVFTGELKNLAREKAKERVRKLGGNISNSVSKNTDFVVIGKEPGSKYSQAKKLNIKTLNKNQFLKIVK